MKNFTDYEVDMEIIYNFLDALSVLLWRLFLHVVGRCLVLWSKYWKVH